MVNYLANRYVLQEEIGKGSMGVVFRAYDRLTSQSVAIKRIKLANASADQRMLFAQEFRTLASLRFPHIISVLDYGFDTDQSPFIAMELLHNATPIHDYARGTGRYTQNFRLIFQLLQAIAYLHRRKIIHRDLKPENVMVVDQTVKVLDFGLATFTELLKPNEHDNQLVGTLAYMSPELLTDGHSELSDLYAIGMIAYEILTGEYPFAETDVHSLIQAIVRQQVDVSRIDASADVQMFVARLIAKDPQDRYQSATEAMHAFLKAIDEPFQEDLFAVQEGFLQSADFVGREQEINQLTAAIGELDMGKGSFWLVGGQSGIGKSRLLRELQTQALVNGINVFTGQAERDIAVLYQMWRTILRQLCLQVPIHPDEAAVLKGILPDIDRLLNMDVSDVISLTPQENQERLLAVVEALFRRLEQPCIIMLEDIHWATEGLLILDQIIRLTQQAPIMIVASYRTDEQNRILERFQTANHIHLERLTREQIKALTGAILGNRVQEQPEVLKLLYDETEGNVLFILEVLRMLAHYAGGLTHIGSITLPQDAFVGGIRRIIEQRFDKLTPVAQAQIRLAALIGRQVDLQLLRYLAPDVDWGLRLSRWSDMAIFEIVEDVWQFIHEKFREYIVSATPAETRQAEHARIAQAIETLYADDQAFYPILAYHWQQARQPERELHYTHLSGDQSLANGAYVQAAMFYERVLEVLNQLPANLTHDRTRLRVLISLGMTLIPIRGETSPEAIQTFEAAKDLSHKVGQNDEIFKVLYNQSIYYMSTAELGRALSLSEQCVTSAQDAANDDLIIEGYYVRSNILFWLGDFEGADSDVQQIVQMYDEARYAHHATEYGQDPFIVGLTYGTWGRWILGYPEQAVNYGHASLRASERHTNRSFNLVMSLQTLAWLYFHIHDVAQCRHYAQRLLDLSEEKGFAFYKVIGQVIMGWVYGQDGNIDTAREWIQGGIIQWQGLQARLLLPFYWLLLADSELTNGEPVRALEVLDTALNTALSHQETTYLAELYRLKGKALALCGQLADARHALDQALEISQHQRAKMFELRVGITRQEIFPSPEHAESLRATIASFTEGFNTPDLKRATNLINPDKG